MTPPITVRLWNGLEDTAPNAVAAVKAAIRLWEQKPVHPGKPTAQFIVAGECVNTVRSLPLLKDALARHEKKRSR